MTNVYFSNPRQRSFPTRISLSTMVTASLKPSVFVRIVWSYASISPHVYMVWRLIKHKSRFSLLHFSSLFVKNLAYVVFNWVYLNQPFRI